MPSQSPSPTESNKAPGTAHASSVPASARVPVQVRLALNLADLVRSAAQRNPDDVALVSGDLRTTWAQLDHAVDATAAGLLRHGLNAGDRVLFLLGNNTAYVTTYFAVLRAGLVGVPVSTAYTAPEITTLIRESDAGLIIAERSSADTARAAISALAASDVVAPEIVVVGETSHDAIIRAGSRSDAAIPATPVDFDTETLALLLFTSGTSGRPKGAMLSHRALLANISQLLSLDPAPVAADDVLLVVLPLFHVYAMNAALGVAVAVGARCVLLERFDPAGSLVTIREEGVTNVAGAPPMYVAWSQTPGLREAFADVRTLVSGAAPLAPAILTLITELSGKPVWEGYGMTEAAPVVATTLSTGRPTPGSVGQPLPGLEVRLLDDSGDAVPIRTSDANSGDDDEDEGDPGEIVLRGANLFSGYWPDGDGGPDADGWWATGDIAYADEHGDLHLVDRRRDLVIVNGFNVYPFEVETVIAAHPDVAEAAVVGVPDAQTGETVRAYVVPLRGKELTEAMVVEHCRSQLARFKCPTTVVIVNSLPHSATGKVAKVRLRADLGDVAQASTGS